MRVRTPAPPMAGYYTDYIAGSPYKAFAWLGGLMVLLIIATKIR